MIVWGEAFLGGSGLVISFSQSNKLLYTQRNTSTQTNKKNEGKNYRSQLNISFSQTGFYSDQLKQKQFLLFWILTGDILASEKKKKKSVRFSRWFWSFVSVVITIAQEARERAWVATTTDVIFNYRTTPMCALK